MENPRVIPKKATEESFNELHYLVTEDFLRRIKSGEATVQDLKAACDWLKTNDITGCLLYTSDAATISCV